jgi:hypothetical protein
MSSFAALFRRGVNDSDVSLIETLHASGCAAPLVKSAVAPCLVA